MTGTEVHMETQNPRFRYFGRLSKLDQPCRSSYEVPTPNSTTAIRPNLHISEILHFVDHAPCNDS